jgi:hypothetical protein
MILPVLVALTLACPADKRPMPEDRSDPQGIWLFPKRTQAQLRGLNKPLAIKRAMDDVSLADLMTHLQDLANDSEAANHLDRRVVILFDQGAFKRLKVDPAYKVVDEKVNLPHCHGATLETVLKLVTKQVDGTFVVKTDHILITTWEVALKRPLWGNELDIQAVSTSGRREEKRATLTDELRNLVHWASEKQPLDEVILGMSQRYEQSIVISPEAAKKANHPVTARFLNVPLKEAVATLADMHGLKLIVKRNVYHIIVPPPATEATKKKAKEYVPWYALPQGKRRPLITLAWGGPICGNPGEPRIDP